MPRWRIALVTCLTAAAALAGPAGASAGGPGGWDRPEQRAAVAAGLLADGPAGFAGELPLAAAGLQGALDALAALRDQIPVAVGAEAPTVVDLDAALVRQLGLGDLADHLQAQAASAGLAPPWYFGTEVVARRLGLRFNHPPRDDALEPYPTDPVSRAEAAYSLARVLALPAWAPDDAREALGPFALPRYGPRRLAALRIAVSLVGMPYVWGGESDGVYSPLGGPQAHGGYDCSGLVWRVFKLSGLPAGASIHGRTAARMAGEIPVTARVPFSRVRPADVLFFGSARLRGRATEATITHTGIALSRRYMIHSSGQGVTVVGLSEPWRVRESAWARHVL